MVLNAAHWSTGCVDITRAGKLAAGSPGDSTRHPPRTPPAGGLQDVGRIPLGAQTLDPQTRGSFIGTLMLAIIFGGLSGSRVVLFLLIAFAIIGTVIARRRPSAGVSLHTGEVAAIAVWRQSAVGPTSGSRTRYRAVGWGAEPLGRRAVQPV